MVDEPLQPKPGEPPFMTAGRKVVAIPATTYESVHLGQLFRVEGFVYVLVAMAAPRVRRSQSWNPSRGVRGRPRVQRATDTSRRTVSERGQFFL
jgi:hypothetical protein